MKSTRISICSMTKNLKLSFNPESLRIPDSSDLEGQVLADLIGNPDMIGTANGVISRGDFSVDAYQRLWDTLCEMSRNGVTIDIATVQARTDRDTLTAILKRMGGNGYGATMDHCLALSEMATRRLVFLRSYEMLTMAGDPSSDMAELIAGPGKMVADLSQTVRSGASTQGVSDVLNDYAKAVEADQVNGAEGKRTRIPTGFAMLDKITYNGFNAGNLVILSARPSVGKTAIMLQMAVEASRTGFPATIYSLEMINRELGQRLVFSTGLVTPKQVANNIVNWNDLERANGCFDKLPLYFNDQARTLDEICNSIALNHQRGRCEIAFIDHLGLIPATSSRQTLYQAITERTARFKRLAKECEIPIVLLCQLNRMSETENRPPDLRDLRDSGSIEQDADIVLMLERATRTLSDQDINMWVRKNRNGRVGDNPIGLRGNNTFTEFHERND